MCRHCEALAGDNLAVVRQTSQDVLEQSRSRVREQPLARFLARQAVLQGMRRVMRANGGHQRRGQPLDDGRAHQCVTDPQEPTLINEPADQRFGSRRRQTQSRDDARTREAGRVALLDQQCQHAPLVTRIRIERRKPAPSCSGPQSAARRVRIEHDPSANGDRRRVRAEDESIATGEDRG